MNFVWLQVLFVCTANVIEMIPNPLLDRMEVIRIAGYITDEKMHIARDYLEKATREACGIQPEQVLCLNTSIQKHIFTEQLLISESGIPSRLHFIILSHKYVCRNNNIRLFLLVCS